MAMATSTWSMYRHRSLRRTMKTGSAVFLVSALVLLVAPRLFVDLLGLPVGFGVSGPDAITWALRMIGLLLVALSVALNLTARHAKASDLRLMSVVMIGVSAALSWLTFSAPGEPTWFRWAYVAVGAAFALAYLIGLSSRR
jgi:inner membrane protein involved in colicin E2 resistance